MKQLPETLDVHEWFEVLPEEDPLTELKLKQYTTEAHVHLRKQVVIFLLWAYGLLLLATMAIIYLQGFRAWGFALEPRFLMWLGGATVAQIGGLLILTVKAVVT